MSEPSVSAHSEDRYRRLFMNLPIAAWESDWSGVLRFCSERGIDTPEAFAAIANDDAAFHDAGATVRVIEVNPVALALLEVGNAAAFEQVRDTYRPESARRFAAAAGQLLFGAERSVTVEVELDRPGREPLCLLLRIAREEGPNIVTIALDMTERRRAEERFRRLFTSLPVAVWEADWSRGIDFLRASGIDSIEAMASLDAARFSEAMRGVSVIALNPATLTLMGLQSAEEHDRWRDRAFPPDAMRRIAAAIAPMTFGDQQSASVELRMRRLTGEMIDTFVHFARGSDWERDKTVIAAAVDVSEAKRTERALLAAKTYVDNLIDTANVLIVELDLEGRAMRLNRMGEEVTGYTLDELANRSWFEVLSPPERKEQAAFYLGSLRQGHMPVADENAIVTRDGRMRMIAWSNTEIRDDAGALVGIISFGVDVTDRIEAEAEQKRLQQAMLRSAEEWRLTFDAVDTPILITDYEGKVTRANRAASALATRPFREIVGQSIAAVRDGEPWSTAADLIRTASNDGRGMTAERKDANGRTWDISVARFPVTDDPTRRFIVVLWETTSTVQLQESLRRSEMLSAMGTLVAGVAHEVRNPLFGISATLDAYQEELSRPGYEELQSALRREVTRMTVLMQELLEYGRAPSLAIEPAALHEVVERAIHRIAVPRTDVQVRNEVRHDLPPVLIDPMRIRQVFENLIDNAMQHAPSHSTVNVSAAAIERGGRSWIEARVEDSGPGFAAKNLQRVFEPFFTTRQDGIGLGLSIVQRIVEEHSGQVNASNRAEGGAVIAVLLPLTS